MNQNRAGDREKNWARILFVEHAYLFLPELERLQSQSEKEVDGLCKIFEEFHVGRESRILDLSCGIGRHSLPLAKRGYQVVGYDPSGFFLQRAKQRAELEIGNHQERVKFYEGEINNIAEILSNSCEGEFNAIISMFNSLGYTDSKDDRRLFKDILNLTINGGILITQTENRDYRIKNFLPYTNYEFDDIEIYESWRFNLENSTAESISKYYRRDSDNDSLYLVLDLPTHMRLYSVHELKELLNEAGWAYQKSYGDIELLKGVTFDTPDIITVSKKVQPI